MTHTQADSKHECSRGPDGLQGGSCTDVDAAQSGAIRYATISAAASSSRIDAVARRNLEKDEYRGPFPQIPQRSTMIVLPRSFCRNPATSRLPRTKLRLPNFLPPGAKHSRDP